MYAKKKVKPLETNLHTVQEAIELHELNLETNLIIVQATKV